MSDKFDTPHGHTEEEVRAAGGMTGCPVCLRKEIRLLKSEVIRWIAKADAVENLIRRTVGVGRLL